MKNKFSKRMITVVFVLFVLGGVALASIPSTNGTISACYSTITGNMKAINTDEGSTCGLFEEPLVLASASGGGVRTVKMSITSSITGSAEDFSLTPHILTLATGEWAYVSASATFDASGCSDPASMAASVDAFPMTPVGLVSYFAIGTGPAVGGSYTGPIFPGTDGNVPQGLYETGTYIMDNYTSFTSNCGDGSGSVVLTQFTILATIFH